VCYYDVLEPKTESAQMPTNYTILANNVGSKDAEGNTENGNSLKTNVIL